MGGQPYRNRVVVQWKCCRGCRCSDCCHGYHCCRGCLCRIDCTYGTYHSSLPSFNPAINYRAKTSAMPMAFFFPKSAFRFPTSDRSFRPQEQLGITVSPRASPQAKTIGPSGLFRHPPLEISFVKFGKRYSAWNSKISQNPNKLSFNHKAYENNRCYSIQSTTNRSVWAKI